MGKYFPNACAAEQPRNLSKECKAISGKMPLGHLLVRQVEAMFFGVYRLVWAVRETIG